MPLRLRIILLTLAVLVPAAFASILGISYVYTKEKESFRTTLQETARALSLVVDREIVAHEAVLATLATSPSLVNNDIATFHKQLQSLAESRGVMFTLTSADGRTLISVPENVHRVLVPAAADLPALFKTASPSNGTLVSDLQSSANKKAHWFSVHRPVWLQERRAYYLTLISPVAGLQKVLGAQRLPAKWVGTVLDRSGRIAANNVLSKARIGTPVPPDLVQRVANPGTEGAFDWINDGGISAVAAFSMAPVSGWTFLIGVPFSEAGRSARDAVTMIVAINVLLLGAATLLAIRLGRSIQGPILRLAEAATALGNGERQPEPATGLHEVEVVSAALRVASERIHDANAVMENRVAEAIEACEQSQRALLQAQKLEALGRLTGGIAHDFNNLLQTMVTGLELAREFTEDPQAKDALTACDGAVGRAVKLTRQLAAFGRNQVSEARPVDLRMQILAMRDLFNSAVRRQVELRLDLAAGLWSVRVDPVQFEMAVLNLIFNARDAIADQGQIVIGAANVALAADEVAGLAPGEYVRLGVRDSGMGMSPDVLCQALDPFFTTKSVGKGSGLGLPQVYGFAKQSDGQLTLDSQPGSGTEAIIYLPRSLDIPKPAECPVPQREPVTGPIVTVLVVEDDMLVRDVVEPALIAYGFRVITAGTADEALAQLDAHPEVEAIFSDIIMPGRLNGVEFAALVRERHPNIPVILATGYSEHTVSASAGLRVMAKPYDVAVLATLLRETLRERA